MKESDISQAIIKDVIKSFCGVLGGGWSFPGYLHRDGFALFD